MNRLPWVGLLIGAWGLSSCGRIGFDPTEIGNSLTGVGDGVPSPAEFGTDPTNEQATASAGGAPTLVPDIPAPAAPDAGGGVGGSGGVGGGVGGAPGLLSLDDAGAATPDAGGGVGGDPGLLSDAGAATQDAGAIVCPTECSCLDFESNTYAFCTAEVIHSVAVERCESAGMVLVRVDSAPENAFLAATRDSLGMAAIWLGGSDSVVEGEWRWGDGTLFWLGSFDGASQGGLYTNWGGEDPNDTNSARNCVRLSSSSLVWYDQQCDQAYQFICEAN